MTPRYGQYLTHAHNHITTAVAAIDVPYIGQHLQFCYSV